MAHKGLGVIQKNDRDFQPASLIRTGRTNDDVHDVAVYAVKGFFVVVASLAKYRHHLKFPHGFLDDRVI
ncbi:MAG: hypothetical protein GTO40_24875 [Deltaproteobacteria bacterium]|nr:hypothetical protein [Deltaproteobacteria bacterium]